ncbi:unnamed protein product [Mycena citricolor]|uniref:ADP-ribosylhydrolase ARH3 n=1 Tax=Mycena citricolor TaxID=2018698 RepID=A0AAD2K0W7_9AGAR|nr:unnamed protein product [Mycena citricolor]
MLPLHAQALVGAPAATKIRLSLLASAMCDALGGPAEFYARFSFPFIAHMEPNDNFHLPPGVWTDDTSMALALARSIATSASGFDEADQLDAYFRWWDAGELSVTGVCFDIGNTIQRALVLYMQELGSMGQEHGGIPSQQAGESMRDSSPSGRMKCAQAALRKIARDLKAPVFGGNGSLMRVLPVGLAYWRSDLLEVADLAKRSSVTTHPNPVCAEACAVWSQCIALVMQNATVENGMMTKLDVLHHFASFEYNTPALEQALSSIPPPASESRAPADLEAHYKMHHPIARLAKEMQQAAAECGPASVDLKSQILAILPEPSVLPSSGYVVHTLCAALYAFLATSTFESGALLVTNMGDDADTVAAVYGGLAGVWYASDGDHTDGLFWTPLVREWMDVLVKKDLLETVAEELIQFQN